MSGALRTIPLVAVVVAVIMCSAPSPAAAASPTGVLCSLTGLVSGALGKVCTVATHAGTVLRAGQKLAGGHVGSAVGTLVGGGARRAATATVGLAAIVAAVMGGARYALKETAKVIGATTRPDLESTWFSSFYWRMAAVSALLTLPFLFAAAVQAMIRSDLPMLGRAAFGYLPLGLLAVGVAAPLTMLLLAGSDEMSAIVSSASGHAGASFLDRAGGAAGAISAASGNLFVLFFIGLLTAAATITLWVELLVRQAAVYVIVLMLPLFFAAMVWPARRVWAIRAVELLVALILSKFAIVAVLALGGAALGHTVLPSPETDLTGATLVLLAAFSPWALLRLLPLHELAGAAAAGMSHQGARGLTRALAQADGSSDQAEDVAAELPARLGLLMRAHPRMADGDDAGNAETVTARLAPGGETRGADQDDGPGGAGAADGAGDPDGAGAPGGAGPPGGAGAPAGEAAPSGDAPAISGESAAGRAQAGERLPGMHAVFQADNGAWRTLNLGEEEFRSDRPLLDAGDVSAELDRGRERDRSIEADPAADLEPHRDLEPGADLKPGADLERRDDLRPGAEPHRGIDE
jgi:hypothetical protein